MTALAYDVRAWVNNLQCGDLFAAMHLLGKRHVVDAPVYLHVSRTLVTIAAVATGINTEEGRIMKGDLVQYQQRGGLCGVGFVLGFGITRGHQHAAFVQACAFEGVGKWRPQKSTTTLVWMSDVVGAVPYALLDSGAIVAMIHADS